MTIPLRPSRRILIVLAIASVSVLTLLLGGVPVRTAWTIAWIALGVLLLAAALDYGLSRRAWHAASPQMTRRLPTAFAIGVRKGVTLSLVVRGGGR